MPSPWAAYLVVPVHFTIRLANSKVRLVESRLAGVPLQETGWQPQPFLTLTFSPRTHTAVTTTSSIPPKSPQTPLSTHTGSCERRASRRSTHPGRRPLLINPIVFHDLGAIIDSPSTSKVRSISSARRTSASQTSRTVALTTS